jgi:uncharacterized cupredoxin-like copper-binding protein
MRPLLALLCLVGCLTVVACTDDEPQRVDVDLTEWTVRPSVAEVKSGRVTFTAHNRSTGMVHELAILRVADGDKTEVKEIEDLDPGKSESVTVTLKPGEYELACLLVPGEAGSTADHYKEGMHTTFHVR